MERGLSSRKGSCKSFLGSSFHRFQLDSRSICVGAMLCFSLEAIVENQNSSIISSSCLSEVMIGRASKSSHLTRFLVSNLLNADVINCNKGIFWLSVSRTLPRWRRNMEGGKLWRAPVVCLVQLPFEVTSCRSENRRCKPVLSASESLCAMQ